MVAKIDSSGTTSYAYDSENRLVQLTTTNSQLVTYKYDPFGRRIEKSVNGVITRYVYDREDILFELDGSGNIVTEFVHGPGIDEPIAMLRNNQTYYYHADGLGSIIAITDSAGQVVQRYEYDSFGNITYQQDPNFAQPYTYTAREHDNESGLYYYRARYYDARVGRFISQDPIGFKGGINFYSYAYNNPLRYIYPEGYLGWDTIIKFIIKQGAKWGLKDPLDKITPPLDPSEQEKLERDDDNDGIPNFQDPDSPWCRVNCNICHY